MIASMHQLVSERALWAKIIKYCPAQKQGDGQNDLLKSQSYNLGMLTDSFSIATEVVVKGLAGTRSQQAS